VQVVWSSRRGSREIEHLGRRMTRRRWRQRRSSGSRPGRQATSSLSAD